MYSPLHFIVDLKIDKSGQDDGRECAEINEEGSQSAKGMLAIISSFMLYHWKWLDNRDEFFVEKYKFHLFTMKL